MKGTHPSEESLQQYGMDPLVCPQEEIDHIADCPHCQGLIALYGFIITELSLQPKPAFGFDLTTVVMEQVLADNVPENSVGVPIGKNTVAVPVREKLVFGPAHEPKLIVLAMWTVIALAIGVPAWLFRKSAYFVFTDMSPAFYWLSLTAAGMVLGLSILRLQKKYQDINNLINK